ncbi:MAG: prenyltransferase/squalene oxidase repeat-containing protein [Planctomycetota bacterium]
MNELPTIAWMQTISDLFTAENLPLLLLFGSGILAVGLLLLALTHWGHSKPVWKCVVLSVVAHVLLMGYAYGTRLIWDSPTEIKEVADANLDELQVTVIDDVGDDETTQFESDSIVPTPLPAAELDLPNIAPLMRPEIDSELVVEITEPEFVPTATPELADQMQLPTEDIPEPVIPLTRDQELAMLPEAKVIDPEPIDMQRQQVSDAIEQPSLDLNSELQRQLIGNDFAMSKQPSRLLPDEVTATLPGEMVRNVELPQPNLAPQLEEISEMRPLPRPTQAAASTSLQVLRRTRRIGDGQPVPEIYSLRNSADRLRIAQRRGGSLETENAVEAALRWLAENQQENGRWDAAATGAGREDRIFGHNRDGAGAKADTGITGLATLAFLAAGHSHLEGDYRQIVRKALVYLAQQQTNQGDLSGDSKLFAKMYCHSMSLLALSEALAMTGDQELLPVVQKGVEFSEYAQNRRDGGWRYQPGDAGDMSQFGWQVLAIKSAKLGGVRVADETLERMQSFLKSCSSGVGNGLASYRPNQGPTTAMTAEALLCRYFLERTVAPMTLSEAQRQISKELPTPKQVNLYYWYYGTLAMYHGGGKEWDRWNKELKATLLPMQIQHGTDRGSFPADGMWGGYGGRVYSTAMATLNLEVYYRYLPIYQELAETRQANENPLR